MPNDSGPVADGFVAEFRRVESFCLAPKFQIGRTCITPGALAALGGQAAASAHSLVMIGRHQSGDWGELDDHDRQVNDQAVAHEGDDDRMARVLSVYTVAGTRCWVITEADRSVTTILLPEEY